MIPNAYTIYVFKNEDGSIPGEGVGTAVLVKFLDKYLRAKEAHLEIWKEVYFTL